MATPVALTSERASLLLCEVREREKKIKSSNVQSQEEKSERKHPIFITGVIWEVGNLDIRTILLFMESLQKRV